MVWSTERSLSIMVLLSVILTIAHQSFGDEVRLGPACQVTSADSQLVALGGWVEMPIFTIGESFDAYTPPGVLDGIGVFSHGDKVRVLTNHELSSSNGYAYTLANGTSLTGARISYFDIDPQTLAVCGAGLAFDTIFNRSGNVVMSPKDLEFGGLNRLCSSGRVAAGDFGLVDSIYFSGEETNGGSEWALDIANGDLWAAPALGRAAFENVALVDSSDPDNVALLIGDDRGGVALKLYVGTKQAGGFLERNGLAQGQLYVWVTDNGDASPEDWNGTGSIRSGHFVAIDYFRPDLAGNGEYDDLGYATQARQDTLASTAGAFRFSRPEDLSTSPSDGTVVTFASTGLSSVFPSDSWGTIYNIDLDFTDLSADVEIIYDSDDAGNGAFPEPDFGLRSPDNLDWADDNSIYVNEDAATDDFGFPSKEEVSIWQLSPTFPSTGGIERIGQVDRTATLPDGQTDGSPDDIGIWETSGILDVSDAFEIADFTLLATTVQAHSVTNGSIGGSTQLVQGGQLLFLIGPAVPFFEDGFESGDTTRWTGSVGIPARDELPLPPSL